MKKKVRGWGFFGEIPIFKEKVGSKKYRFTTQWTKNVKVEAFSSTGKIRDPDKKPKVQSQAWRRVKGGRK